MKRHVILGLAAAFVFLIAGCALPKSYYVATGDNVTGSCFQVTTTDADIRSSLIAAGYAEGTCDVQGFAGTHYCTYSSVTADGTYEVSIYWGTSFSPTDIETTCTTAGWTYH